MIVFSKMSKLTSYYRNNAYVPDMNVLDHRTGQVAAVLFIANIVFMTRAYAVSNLLETLLFGLFIFTPGLRGQLVKVIRDPLIIPLILFFIWTLVSGIWGHGSFLEIVNDWWGWRKLLLLPIGLVILSHPRVLKVTFTIALFVALLFLGLALVGWGFDIGSIWGRPYTSVLQNHNAQGIYFCLSAVGLIASISAYKSQGMSKAFKWCIALALIGFTIYLGSSRSGYVAAAFSILFISILGMRNKFLAAIVSALVVVAVVFSSSFATHRIQLALSEMAVGAGEQGGTLSSGSARVVMWKNTLGIIKEHWLLGTGAAGFDDAYTRQVAEESGWRASTSDNPHSHYLHVWAEYGLIGLGLFLWFLLAIFFRADRESPWGLALLTTLLTASAIGTFDGVFGSAINGRIVIIAFAMFLAAINNRDDQELSRLD